MKLHNEIQEQKSKKERAHRELKMSRHAAKTKLDKEFFNGFEVKPIYIYHQLSYSILTYFINTERHKTKRTGIEEQFGSSAGGGPCGYFHGNGTSCVKVFVRERTNYSTTDNLSKFRGFDYHKRKQCKEMVSQK